MSWLKRKWDACKAWAKGDAYEPSPMCPQNYLCAAWGAFLLAGGARTLVKDGLSLELLLTIPLGVFSGLLLLLIVCFPWVVIDETLSKEGKRVPNIVRAGLKVATMVAYTVIAIRLI